MAGENNNNLDLRLLEANDLERIVESQAIDKATSVERDLLVFQLDWSLNLRAKLDNEGVELKIRQSKVEYVHGVLRELGNLRDEKNGIDLTNHPELQEKLRRIRDEMGIEILADQTKFTNHQTNTLIGNLNSAIEDWDMLNQSQMRKVTSLYTELLQSLTYIKQAMSMLDRPKRRSITGIGEK